MGGLEFYYDLEKLLENFNVDGRIMKQLNPDQVYLLNQQLKSFKKKLILLSIILFFVLLYAIGKPLYFIYTEILVYLFEPLTEFFLQQEVFVSYLISGAALILATIIATRTYEFIGHHFILLKLQEFEYQSKIDENEPKQQKKYPSHIQKEIDKIRTLGKKNETTK